MHMECYQGSIPALLSALSSPEGLERWRAYATVELQHCADVALQGHLKWLLRVCADVQAYGLDLAAQRDRAGVDALLTDHCAVATWCGWPLPLRATGSGELPLELLQRGLLGADMSTAGALLFLLNEHTLALVRNQAASDQADFRDHWAKPDPTQA